MSKYQISQQKRNINDFSFREIFHGILYEITQRYWKRRHLRR